MKRWESEVVERGVGGSCSSSSSSSSSSSERASSFERSYSSYSSRFSRRTRSGRSSGSSTSTFFSTDNDDDDDDDDDEEEIGEDNVRPGVEVVEEPEHDGGDFSQEEDEDDDEDDDGVAAGTSIPIPSGPSISPTTLDPKPGTETGTPTCIVLLTLICPLACPSVTIHSGMKSLRRAVLGI